MSRLIRCIEGHIFEADKGPNCPICGAATSLTQQATAPEPVVVADDTAVTLSQQTAADQTSERKPRRSIGDVAGTIASALPRPGLPVLAGLAGAVVVAIGITAYALWPASAPATPMPPGADSVPRLAAADMEALSARLDRLAPESKGDASKPPELRLPNDGDGSAAKSLQLSEALVTGLGYAHGAELVVAGDGRAGLRLLAIVARRDNYAAWAALGEGLARRRIEANDVRVGTNALIFAGNAGVARGHQVASTLLSTEAFRDLKNRQEVAEKHLKLAAQLGDSAALRRLGESRITPLTDNQASVIGFFHQDRLAGLPALIAAARRGWPEAALEVANELGGVARGDAPAPGRLKIDRVASVDWFRFTASRGHVGAMRQLGHAYVNGAGVQANPAEAWLWFYLAFLEHNKQSTSAGDMMPAELRKSMEQVAAPLDEQQKATIAKLLLPPRQTTAFATEMLKPRAPMLDHRRQEAKSSPDSQKQQTTTVPPRPQPQPQVQPQPQPQVQPQPQPQKRNEANIAPLSSGLPDSDLLVRPGASADVVRLAYHIPAVATPFGTGIQSNRTQLRKPEEGMMFFFTSDSLDTIRLDKPFAGRVVGQRLGDPLTKVKSAFGEPVNVFDFASNKANVYRKPDWPVTIRFDIDSEGKIATIFIFK